MAFIKDLSPVSYHNLEGPIKAVGWLESSHCFPQGTAEAAFIDKLWTLIERPIFGLGCLGMHFCSLCAAEGKIGPDSRSSQCVVLVPTSKWVYETPIWIGHYVQQHSYLPPVEFQEAVADCAQAGSEELWLATTALIPGLEQYTMQPKEIAGQSVSFFGTWDAQSTIRPCPEYGDERALLEEIERDMAETEPPPTREQLVERHGGLSTTQCKWARCGNLALADMVVCVEHAYP